jgi:hypothetical protein
MSVAAWERQYVRRIVRRAVLLWLPLRVLLAGAALGQGLDARLGVAGVLLAGAVLATLCAVDARFMREPLFQAQLGTPAWAAPAAGVMVVLAVEAVVALLYAAAAVVAS